MSKTLIQQAEVIVIGGGIVGCSVLYHLSKLGVRKPLLLERHRLTSGTTWHSAAQVRQLRSAKNLTRLIQYSTQLYAQLEAETGQATGWQRSGSISIACNTDRLIHIRRQAALARAYGIRVQEMSATEVKQRWPLAHHADILGAALSPDDGRVNPSDLCAALIKAAKTNGAQVLEKTPVLALQTRGQSVCGVITAEGAIRCDKIAICAGLWSRELAASVGIDLPVWPCEHFYLLTRPIEGIAPGLPTLSDHDSHLYIRDEVGGLLVGCFEPAAKALDPQQLGDQFAFSLLDEDWDHFEPMMHNALHRVPALAQAEVRTLLNGPESFTPDGNFILGESAKLSGLFLACGMNSVGIASGGGVGWALAHAIRHGSMPFDLRETDPNRFHPRENQRCTLPQRASEVLSKHYEIAYPGRQFDSARNLRASPLQRFHSEHKAHWVQSVAWERPAYFGCLRPPKLSFNRPPWFGQIASEVDSAHTGAALFDQSMLGKIHVSGAGAEAFLSRLLCSDMRKPAGSIIYSLMLNSKGRIDADLIVLRVSETEYLLYVGTQTVVQDLSRLQRAVRSHEAVKLEDVTEAYAVIALMGPASGKIVQSLGLEELLDLPYFQHCKLRWSGCPLRAARFSYVGEPGWELSCEAHDATKVYQRLLEAGCRPAGLYAQTSMRIEKAYCALGHELDSDTMPIEAGLAFALNNRENFVGKAATQTALPSKRLVTVLLDDSSAVPLGDEPIYHNGEMIGQATSASFGFRVNQPILLAYIDPQYISPQSTTVAVDLAGQQIPATALLGAAYDPAGARMRQRWPL